MLDRSHGPADLKTKEPTPQILQTTDDHLHMLTPSNTTHVPRNGTANPRHEGSLGINPSRTNHLSVEHFENSKTTKTQVPRMQRVQCRSGVLRICDLLLKN
jgi:hypothetical protein